MITVAKNLFTEVLGKLNIYYEDEAILAFAVIAGLYLFVSEKELRKKLIYPVLLMIFVVLNPVVYYVLKDSFKSYWRIFWLIPDIIIIALAISKLVNSQNRLRNKLFMMAFVTAVIVFLGADIFAGEEFGKRTNQYGLSETAVSVADTMLSADESPRCICPHNMTWHMRAYNANIETMYGRDIEGYIVYTDYQRSSVSKALEAEEPDYDIVLKAAVDGGFNFIVAAEEHPVDDVTLFQYGFEIYKNTCGYNIYMSNGQSVYMPVEESEEE